MSDRQLSMADVRHMYAQGRIDDIERALDAGRLDELRAEVRGAKTPAGGGETPGPPSAGQGAADVSTGMDTAAPGRDEGGAVLTAAPDHQQKGKPNAITNEYELDEHEMALLVEAVRTVDQLDQLDAAVRRDGVLVDGRPHPALVEARQQRIVLSRLLASLRMPEGEAVGRPQRRGAARPPYGRAS